MNKRCSNCKELKDISDFNKAGKYYHSYCKNCFRKYQKKYLSNPKNEEKQREWDKEYQRKKRALGLVNKTQEGRLWHEKHPKARNARALVKYYLKKGKIKKGKCSKCGSKNVYAHHPDYNKPLKIKWMCPSCHKKFHLGILVD